MSIASCTQGTNKHYHLENKNVTKQLALLPFSSTPAPFPSFLAETKRQQITSLPYISSAETNLDNDNPNTS
jgi:hypothetical protein